MTENQGNGYSSSGISSQLRQIRGVYSREVLPALRRKAFFKSKGEERRRKRGKKTSSFQMPVVVFSPFAQTLGSNPVNAKSASRSRKNKPIQLGTALNQSNQIVSVFVIAMFKANPPVFLLQKVQKKSAPGFPSGRIENGETILQAAVREFKEESGGRESAGGIDITPYNPLCIGEFVLDKAVNGERGSVVLVEIPENEIANLKVGGGAEEGEVVEELFRWTFEEVLEKAQEEAILPNSIKAWNLYLEYLIK
jgi:8-oxo-dGTP pyrophosphatase MutT (NUDIX family)